MNTCNWQKGMIQRVIFFRDKKDERRFLDPKTTERVKKNIINRATVYNYN
jgi:hypothetical protein